MLLHTIFKQTANIRALTIFTISTQNETIDIWLRCD